MNTETSFAGRSTFFSAADDTLCDVLGQKGFDQSLIHNLLFGGSLVIDESFFFNSSLLLAHVQSGSGKSLFEVAAKSGLIRPAFRTHGETDLISALSRMRKTYAPGFLPATLNSSHRAIVRAVQEGLEASHPAYPAEGFHLATNFQREMTAYFLESTAPGDTTPTEWKAMEEWRELIPEACGATSRRGLAGLQRAELVRSISGRLGISSDVGLLPLPTLLSYCGTPERQRTLKTFWLRMNHIHGLNSARAYSSCANFPSCETRRASRDHFKADLGRLLLSHQVKLPSSHALSRVEPRLLLRARADEGRTLYEILTESSPNPEDIKLAFDRYSDRLCELAREARPSILGFSRPVRRTVTALTTAAGIGLGGAALLEKDLGDKVEKFLNVGNAGLLLVGVGMAAEAIRRTRPIEKRIEITLEPAQTPEDTSGSNSSRDAAP